jgi:hypothetical protein
VGVDRGRVEQDAEDHAGEGGAGKYRTTFRICTSKAATEAGARAKRAYRKDKVPRPEPRRAGHWPMMGRKQPKAA